MAITAAYNYEVEASLVLENGKEIDLIPETFQYIIIDHDYDNKNMPCLYIGLKVNSKTYNQMVKYINTAVISFFMYKYDKNATNKLRKKYIEGQFIYFMDNVNPNYQEELETETDDGEEIQAGNYKVGCIGLLQIESLNNNKIVNNAIIKNSRLSSVVHKFTKHMNMVIEPFTQNPMIRQLIIPPTDSITKLLAYLNNQYSFYKTNNYRYYRDFHVTYLLSSRGNPIDMGDNIYNTIIINILDKSDYLGKENSTTIDSKNKSYIINIDSDNTDIDIGNITDKIYNSIMGIDINGNTRKVDLSISKNSNSTEKVILKRVSNVNSNSIDVMKDNIDKSNCIITITKTELDNSVITPNREFQVSNCKEYKQYDGRYLLSSKKEVFLPQEEKSFIGSTSFVLRKV